MKTSSGGRVFGRRVEVVRAVLVDMSTHVQPKDIDREMLGLDAGEEVSEVKRLKDQLSAMRYKFADVRARFDGMEVR